MTVMLAQILQMLALYAGIHGSMINNAVTLDLGIKHVDAGISEFCDVRCHDLKRRKQWLYPARSTGKCDTPCQNTHTAIMVDFWFRNWGSYKTIKLPGRQKSTEMENGKSIGALCTRHTNSKKHKTWGNKNGRRGKVWLYCNVQCTIWWIPGVSFLVAHIWLDLKAKGADNIWESLDSEEGDQRDILRQGKGGVEDWLGCQA